jgi:hypothetical protein
MNVELVNAAIEAYIAGGSRRSLTLVTAHADS